MASATMHIVSDIYAPSSLATFYIDPSKVTWSNGTSNVGSAAGWNVVSDSSTNPLYLYIGQDAYRYSHAYYVHIPPGGWAPDPFGTLTFRFPDAAVKVATGDRYTLKVDFVTGWAFNGDNDHGRDIGIITLSNDNDSIPFKGFWVNAMVIGNQGGANNHCAVSITIRLSIVNSAGTTQSGTFYYPFTGLNSVYDVPTVGPGEKKPNGDYAESAEILSNCTQIYAETNSKLSLWYGPSGSKSRADVSGLNGQSFSYTSGVAGSGLWFCNNSDNMGVSDTSVGIVGLFSSGAQIQWRGSDCGTHIRGESMLTTIKYDGNAPAGATTSNVPGNQYKAKKHDLTLSSQVPTCTGSGRRYTFKGWSKTESGSVAYQPGGTFTEDNVNGSITLYAIWEPAYLITLNLQGGYAWINNKWDSTSPIGDWVPGGSSYTPGYTLQRLGYTFGGWSTTAGGSPYQFPVQNVTGPMTFYAIWTKKSFQVRFHDGYTAGNDVIKTVTVSYGGSVPSTEVPVPGQTYSGRVFKKPGMYSFEGWAGSWTNVTSDRDVIALWEFTPIWVKKNNKWVKYKPVEP